MQAAELYQGLTQILRLAIDENFAPGKASGGLIRLMLRAADAPDLPRLEAQIAETQAQVREIFLGVLAGA